jgi:hypothetical protein
MEVTELMANPFFSSIIVCYKRKKSKQKRAGGMPQAVECLPSKLKALSSNPTIAKKKKKKKKREKRKTPNPKN